MTVALPTADEHAPHFATYISKVTGPVDPVPALQAQREAVFARLTRVPEDKGSFRYAPGKWSLKQSVAHVADAERVFAYRMLRAVRGDETPLSGFDENAWVANSRFDDQPLAALVEDLLAVRAATITLARGVSADEWLRQTIARERPVSARALLYVTLGHAAHHDVLFRERYLV